MAATGTRQTAIHRKVLGVLLAGACMGGCEHSPPLEDAGAPSVSSELSSLAAARTMAARVAEHPATLDALVSALDDPMGRDAALLALGHAGDAAANAVPEVIDVLRAGDTSPALALWCLGRIGAHDERARNELLRALRAEATPPTTRREVALALIAAGALDEDSLDEAMAALGTPLPFPALLRAGARPRARAHAILVTSLDGSNPAARDAALRIVAEIAPLESLVALLPREDDALQSALSRGAYRVVEDMRGDAPVRDPELLGELARQLTAAPPAGRVSAALLLEQCIERLGEEHVPAERIGAWLSGAHGPPPSLPAALDDPDPTVRKAAARALWAVGEADADALETLQARARRDDDPEVRQAARAALERVAP